MTTDYQTKGVVFIPYCGNEPIEDIAYLSKEIAVVTAMAYGMRTNGRSDNCEARPFKIV